MNFLYCSIRLLTLTLLLTPSFCYPVPDINATLYDSTVCNLRHYERNEDLKFG